MRIHTLKDVRIPHSPKTLTEWETLRREMLAQVRFSFAADLYPQDIPLNAVILPAVEKETYVVEKVIFQTLSGFYTAGNLYRPKDISKKYPGILNPHGHWKGGRLNMDDRSGLVQRCANLAMRGMVALIWDPVGVVDSVQVPHVYSEPEFEKWNYSRFTLQIHNGLRALDFLCSLPYVDPERIGCTGASGGASQTIFLTALDDRIRAAAPVNMVSTFMQGGCVCENTAFLRTDFCNVDFASLIAPRPLFMAAADGDWTIHSETREFPAIQKIYDLYGQSERFEHIFVPGPHSYNRPSREYMYDFFCRVFGLNNPYNGEIDPEIDPNDLVIGDLTRYVPNENYITGDDQLFEVVRTILRANRDALSAEAQADLDRRIFLLDREFSLDIPYLVDDEDSGSPVYRFEEPPADPDPGLTACYYTYNFAPDSQRISALVHLMKAHPEACFEAYGKSAALCALAGELAGFANLKLAEPDFQDVFVPGFALSRFGE